MRNKYWNYTIIIIFYIYFFLQKIKILPVNIALISVLALLILCVRSPKLKKLLKMKKVGLSIFLIYNNL